MGLHRTPSIERLIRRTGAPVTVRRKVGELNPVTSTRTSPKELEVATVGFYRRPTQKSMQGDPLSTQDAYFLVPAAPFRGMFTPRDSDLVIAGDLEARILSVRHRVVRGEVIAYTLYVSGVAF